MTDAAHKPTDAVLPPPENTPEEDAKVSRKKAIR
jgi:hypothetical protein